MTSKAGRVVVESRSHGAPPRARGRGETDHPRGRVPCPVPGETRCGPMRFTAGAKSRRPSMDLALVARLPAAAMNPDDDRVPFALGRGVHVEGLSFVLRLGVGEATVDAGVGGIGRGGEDEKRHADLMAAPLVLGFERLPAVRAGRPARASRGPRDFTNRPPTRRPRRRTPGSSSRGRSCRPRPARPTRSPGPGPSAGPGTPRAP